MYTEKQHSGENSTEQTLLNEREQEQVTGGAPHATLDGNDHYSQPEPNYNPPSPDHYPHHGPTSLL